MGTITRSNSHGTHELFDLEKYSTHEKRMGAIMEFVAGTLPQDQIPFDSAAEVVVIGTLIQYAEAFPSVSKIIQAGDFYWFQHGLIYEAMQICFVRDSTYDPITIADELESHLLNGQTWLDAIVQENFTGRAALVHLTQSGNFATYQHIEMHALIIKALSRRRAMMQMAYNTFWRALDREKNITQITQEITDDVNRSLGHSLQLEDSSLDAILEVYYVEWEAKLKAFTEGKAEFGLPTGIITLDAMTGGIHKGETTYIGGLNGVGKTTLLLQVLYNAAKRGSRVIFFSLEMDKRKVIQRLLSLETGIPLTRIRSFAFESAEEVSRVNAAIGLLQNLDFILIDKYQADELSPALLKLELSYYLSQKEIHMVGVDGLWLMRADGDNWGKLAVQDAYDAITKSLAAMTRSLQLRLWITHQLNNNYQQRQNKRPVMSDFKGGTPVRNNADCILLLHRDSHPEIGVETEHPTKTEIIIGKNRDDRKGKVIVDFNTNYMRFDVWQGEN